MKQIFMGILFVWLLVACGSNTTTPKEQNLEREIIENNNTEDSTESSFENNETESNMENHVSVEGNSTLEQNQTVVLLYSDEVLIFEADSTYTTNNPSTVNSAKIISLSFKGILPVENNTPIVKAENNFTIELNWQNPAYAQNINYYFFNGSQRSIQYLSFPLAEGVSSYTMECQMLGTYHYKCSGFEANDEKYYVGKSFPIRSSFVMSLCDRSTQDPSRVCDFIRIPVELRE